MKKVLKGEAESRTMSVANDSVHVHHVTLNKTTDALYALDWKFNFDGVSHEELLKLATRTMVIQVRPAFKREKADKLDDWEHREFSVREYLDSAGRKQADPVAKVKSLTEKMTAEQKAALLAELQGE